MQSKIIYKFIIRWLVSSLGLWIAAGLSSNISYNSEISVIIIAGLILAIINSIIKPLLILLSLPVIVFTLGLFILVINGLTVYIVSRVYPTLHISNFWTAIFAGIIIGLVNYLVTVIIKSSKT